jgi:hypothetical protein
MLENMVEIKRIFSWPAVSQISNFTVVSSRQTVWVRKAAENKKTI